MSAPPPSPHLLTLASFTLSAVNSVSTETKLLPSSEANTRGSNEEKLCLVTSHDMMIFRVGYKIAILSSVVRTVRSM